MTFIVAGLLRSIEDRTGNVNLLSIVDRFVDGANAHLGTAIYGLKPWLSQMGDTVPTFLTTEEVVAQTIKKAYRQRLLSLELDNLPGIFPIKVPVFIDRRAKSDRVQAEELNVSALAQEILEADKNAVVISDGGKGPHSGCVHVSRYEGFERT